MIVAATGHRLHLLPGYRGDGSSQKIRTMLLEVAMDAVEAWSPDLTITGMATGWDMAVGMACMLTNRPYHAYIPFVGQDWAWNETDKAAYRTILEEAEEVVTICPSVSKRAYYQRDMAMVDKANHMLSLWNGDPATGTGITLGYAEGWLVPHTNYFDAYVERYENGPRPE